MSTRSSIAVNLPNGTVRSIYCHFDGYLSHVGHFLQEHYNSQEHAEALVALGDCSSLAESIACPDGHSFKHQMDGHAVFYGRDRGETGVEATEHPDYATALHHNKQAYNYYWDGTKWLVDEGPDASLIPLAEALKAENS